MIDNVARPIQEVTAVMNEMTEGNMHVAVSGTYKGEFGVLSHAVNHLAQRLLAVGVRLLEDGKDKESGIGQNPQIVLSAAGSDKY